MDKEVAFTKFEVNYNNDRTTLSNQVKKNTIGKFNIKLYEYQYMVNYSNKHPTNEVKKSNCAPMLMDGVESGDPNNAKSGFFLLQNHN